MKKHHAYLVLSLVSLQVFAGPQEQAYKLHNRIAGVPPVKTASSDPLADMTSAIKGGQPEMAAAIAMKNKNFYNVVLKNWIKPWSNREQTSELN